MAYSDGNADTGRLRFGVGEVTGALGDSVTVLPLLVGLAALTPVPLAHALLFFGVFQAVWGLVYGLPLSVEPMKALAGLALAGAFTYGEFLAAGLLAGVVLLGAGSAGALSRLQAAVGEPVVRGVQLAVALLLASAGLELGVANPPLAVGAAAVTAVVVALGAREGAALAVLGLGAAFTVATAGVSAPSLPGLAVFPAGGPTFTAGALSGAAGQLAMTVGNAAVATSLLCADLFDADVSPDRLSRSMGATCLVAVPFGGVPMCHGSGGLAGKHAFGARTGGANVVVGVLYLVAVPFAGVVASFPTAVLGVLLLVVAGHLGRRALAVEAEGDRDPCLGPVTAAHAVVVAVGVVGLAWNVGAAFLLGVGADAVRRRLA